jgi:membrane protein
MQKVWILLRDTVYAYLEDDAPRLGAALAFYVLMSLPPALMLISSLLTKFIDAQLVQGQMNSQLVEILGERAATIVVQIVQNSEFRPKSNWGYTLIGIFSAWISAMGASVQLQASFNTIWGVRVKAGTGNVIWNFVKGRLLSMVILLSIGAFVTTGLIVTTILSTLNEYISGWISNASFYSIYIGNFVMSYLLFLLIFAIMFRYIPDVVLRWRDVWVGAVLTTVLFGIGRYLIGLYLSQMDLINAYGVAGSLVVLLLWVFYSLQILFFGVEFTKILYEHKGKRIRPYKHAEKIAIVAQKWTD